MDSKAITERFWPLLREHGFARTSSRTAWRHGAQKIDVVNFQSFNSYNAEVLGVTMFSFALNLGAYLRYVPPQWPPKKVKEGVAYPAEHECQFRGHVLRTLSQPRNKYEHIWLVEKDGRNLPWCINVSFIRMLPMGYIIAPIRGVRKSRYRRSSRVRRCCAAAGARSFAPLIKNMKTSRTPSLRPTFWTRGRPLASSPDAIVQRAWPTLRVPSLRIPSAL